METMMQNPSDPATRRQLWALFCATKTDFRGKGLTKQEASDKLQSLTNVPIQEPKMPKANFSKDAFFADVFEKANKAADEAGAAQYAKLVAAGPKWVVTDELQGGKPIDTMLDLCGFGWVILKDKRHPFHKWLKKNQGSRYSGYAVPIYSEWKRRQEVSINEAMAEAAAKVYNENDIPCYVESRLD